MLYFKKMKLLKDDSFEFGEIWSGDLYHDGKLLGHVADSATGGPVNWMDCYSHREVIETEMKGAAWFDSSDHEYEIIETFLGMLWNHCYFAKNRKRTMKNKILFIKKDDLKNIYEAQLRGANEGRGMEKEVIDAFKEKNKDKLLIVFNDFASLV